MVLRENMKTQQGTDIVEWKTMPNVKKENWDNEYYYNVTEDDIKSIFNLDEVFSKYKFEIEENHCDLYFWGIKK